MDCLHLTSGINFACSRFINFPFGERNRHANARLDQKYLLVTGAFRMSSLGKPGLPTPCWSVEAAATDNGTGANFSLRADQVGNPNVGICGRLSGAVLRYQHPSSPRPPLPTGTSSAALSKVRARSAGDHSRKNFSLRPGRASPRGRALGSSEPYQHRQLFRWYQHFLWLALLRRSNQRRRHAHYGPNDKIQFLG